MKDRKGSQSMSKITENIYNIAKPVVESQGLNLVDVEYTKEGSERYLRVFIENLDGDVTLENCEDVSKVLSEKLDQLDPINDSYILEVSSPGLERPLKKKEDFDRFKDNLVFIKTYAPINGNKEFNGILVGRENDNVLIKMEGEDEIINIPLDKISTARLAIDFG